MSSSDSSEETVTSIAKKVANGVLTAHEAGLRMRSLVTHRKPATTFAERYEQFHELAIEEDLNSFVHVIALHHLGRISSSDYAAIRKGLDFSDKPATALPLALVSVAGADEIEAAAATVWLGSAVTASAADDEDIADALTAQGTKPTSENIAAVRQDLVSRLRGR